MADLRKFPPGAKQDAGYQLDRLQQGKLPDDFKPMPEVGPGVAEIRIWNSSGTFRVMYVAKLEDAIHVLHCFEKRTQRTPRKEMELASARFKALMKEQRP